MHRQLFSDKPCKQGGLVKAAPKLLGPVQRYRDQYVGSRDGSFLLPCVCHFRRHKRCKMRAAAILKSLYHLPCQSAVGVNGNAIVPVAPAFANAFTADLKCAVDRCPACDASRPRKALQNRKTIGARTLGCLYGPVPADDAYLRPYQRPECQTQVAFCTVNVFHFNRCFRYVFRPFPQASVPASSGVFLWSEYSLRLHRGG